MISAVLQTQRAWAERHALRLDPLDYLPDYRANLRAPLSRAAHAAFAEGSGSELEDQSGRPAKMRALRSSSALAVNVFDFWTGRDLARVAAALGVSGRATELSFEQKLPTGARGTPPNVDVVIRFDDGRLVGVESKLTEWMARKTGMATNLARYVHGEASSWSRAGLHASHHLVQAMQARDESFQYLDAPQLLKHALGLNRAAKGDWYLRYVFLDAPGEAQAAHAEEVARFDRAVGSELRFRAVTYQEFVASLGPTQDEAETSYFGYLRDRYFGE